MRLLPLVLLIAAASVVATPAIAQAPGAESARWQAAPRMDPRLVYVVVKPAGPGMLATKGRAGPSAGVQAPGRHSTLQLATGGVLGGGLGLVGGFVVGRLIAGESDRDCIDMCFDPAMILGTLAGEALGIALGVNAANGFRGHTGLGILTSTAILAGGMVLMTEMASGTLVLAIPVTQLIGTITTERRTEHARAGRRAGS